MMPSIRLAGAGFIPWKYLKYHIGIDSISLLPAVSHPTAIYSIRINENHKFASDFEETWVTRIMVVEIGQVAVDLCY